MSYLVLARRWRPRNFQELVGQEHVVQALVNSLQQKRLHHAYLFTGTRGVGKTTIARVLAKCLNCESGISSTPCGQCRVCREIDAGRFIDLLEVDAASRTRVEDTRELLENVQYSPTTGRYKVYLIDEVHMLSAHSFNALLKTLEEPPPHVKFLLATTDPQKVPVTILSRSLQFNLKPMPASVIASHLAHILGNERIEYEESGLRALARAADGSMRDALSLLDQAIAFGNGTVRGAEVDSMLGHIGQDRVFELLEALVSDSPEAVLSIVRDLAEIGVDSEAVLTSLLALLHQVALAGTVPQAIDDFDGDQERLKQLADTTTAEDVQLFYQIGVVGRRDLPLAPDTRSGLEMILLRMLAFRPAGARALEGAPAISRASANSSAKAKTGNQVGKGPDAQSLMPKRASGAEIHADTASRSADSDKVMPRQVAQCKKQKESRDLEASVNDAWAEIVGSLELRGMPYELAANSELRAVDGKDMYLTLPAAHAHLYSLNFEKRLSDALGRYYGSPINLHIELSDARGETPAQRQKRLLSERRQEAYRAIESDPVVLALQEKFNAHVRADSVQSLEPDTRDSQSDS